MNRHEEGALGDPIRAGNPVYDPDGRRCSQISFKFKGHRAAAGPGRCVGSSGHGLASVTSSKGLRPGWAHSADARPEAHRVKLFQAADCSMDSMRVEIMHVWNTQAAGTPPGRQGFIPARMCGH